MTGSTATSPRLTGKGTPPSLDVLAAHLGKKGFGFWQALEDWVVQKYPGIFAPEWLYGGAKHGWSRRYKKGRSFCTLIPEKGILQVLIVFGREEREKVEARLAEFPDGLQERYRDATTYHDGKWLLLPVAKKADLLDVCRLLEIKRRPRG